MSLGQYHHEQRFSNSCLAACVVIARIRTGMLTPADAPEHERDLCERLGAGRGGISICAAAEEIDSQQIVADPNSPKNYAVLQENLASGQWWHIVILGSGELAEHHERLGLSASSRHGALSPPVGPPHAVILVEAEPEGLLYLDPWFAVALQPQRIALDVFARAWTGMFIPVRLP